MIINELKLWTDREDVKNYKYCNPLIGMIR